MGMMAARYRDLRFLLPSLSMLFFFLTPIYWQVNMLGPKAWIAKVNPLYNMVNLLRQPLLGTMADKDSWIYCICFCLLGFIGWLTVFSLFRRRIPFWV
jgi:ABC-2 type transport system permease protein/lipopolysaccharide transport system permease protein